MSVKVSVPCISLRISHFIRNEFLSTRVTGSTPAPLLPSNLGGSHGLRSLLGFSCSKRCVYCVFCLSFSLLPTPAPSEARGIPPFFKLKSVPSYGSKRRTFRTAQQFCSVLKCHPDQSTLWEFLFSGPKCLLPHSSAPKQGQLIPPKFCSFLQQSSFFPHNIHQVPKV